MSQTKTIDDEDILMESGPSITGSVASVGLKLSLLTLFILPLLHYTRSRYVITEERIIIENRALSSSTSEVRIEDVQQVSTFSKFLGGSGISVVVGSGTGIDFPIADASEGANVIRSRLS